MYCAKCGAPLNGAAFCGSCGTSATGAPVSSVPYSPVPDYMNPPKYNGLAIAGFVCSLLGCTALVGFILSLVALNQITKAQPAQQGRGLALAGAIVGGLWLLYVVVVWVNATSSYVPQY